MENFDHQEYYMTAIREMGKDAMGKFTLGWLRYASEKYPDLYKKYRAALMTIQDLWGNQDPEIIEKWKQAVKNEAVGSKYFIDKYQGYLETNPPLVDPEDMPPASDISNVSLGQVSEIVIEVTGKMKIEEVVEMTAGATT